MFCQHIYIRISPSHIVDCLPLCIETTQYYRPKISQTRILPAPLVWNLLLLYIYFIYFGQFHQELHCLRNCIASGTPLYQELHCIGNCNALGITLHRELHCIRNCIALGIALHWEFHCIRNCMALKIGKCNALGISSHL